MMCDDAKVDLLPLLKINENIFIPPCVLIVNIAIFESVVHLQTQKMKIFSKNLRLQVACHQKQAV